MTRAKDRLILCGWHGAKPEKEQDLRPDSWAALVRDVFGEGAEPGPTPLTDAQGEPVIAQIFEIDGTEAPGAEGPGGDDLLTHILGTIDRLIVEDGIVHIVDFKSGRPADPVPAPYRRQLALYRAALGDIFSGADIVAHLVWIDANRAVQVETAALDEALAGMLADGTLDAPMPRG